ncbi:MAG: hypothetical protein ACOY9J_04630 [Pseudomonadota bacterium]
MLTTNAYLMAWIFYLLAAGGLMLVLFRMTRGWRPVAFRIVLRAIGAVWLFMPAVVEPGAARESLAPAFVVLMFDLLQGYEIAARVLEPMLILTVVVIPVVLGADWAWTRWRTKCALVDARGRFSQPIVPPGPEA